MSSTNDICVHFGDLPDGFTSPDVYFTPGYGRAASLTDGGEWVLLEAFGGAWQIPLILRTLSDGARDAVSPYGYSGVYASPALSSLQVQAAWAASISSLQDLNVISVLLRHSPLVPQPSHLPGLRSIVSGHPTIVLDLVDADSAWSNMAGTCRTATRKALKNGYTSWVRQAESRDLKPDGDFRRLYEQTMRHRHAAPAYFFSDGYYTDLLDGLGSNLFISEVRDRTGLVASSGLIMRHSQRLHGHLGGSNMDDARLGANNLLAWAEMQFAIDQGLREYHLGGGVSSRDSLFKFKRSFGGREVEYRVSGLIIDHDRYGALTENRAKACETTVEELLVANYFPAYRGGKL